MNWHRGIRSIFAAVRPLLEEVRTFTASLESGQFDFGQPRTALKAVAERLTAASFHVRGIDQLIEPVVEPLLRRMAQPEVLEQIRREVRSERSGLIDLAAEALADSQKPDSVEAGPAEENARITTAKNYLDGLHVRLPYAPLAIVFRPGLWTPEFLWDVLRLVHLRHRARATEGEARVYALEDYTRHLTERVYQRYVETLAFAEILARPNRSLTDAKFGQRVNELLRDPSTRPLIHPDAARLRNSASHLGGWRYLEDGVEILHGATIRRRTYTLDELDAECEQILSAMLSFATALADHAGERLCDFILDTQAPEIIFATIRGDAMDDVIVEQERSRFEALFGPLRERWQKLFPNTTPELPPVPGYPTPLRPEQ